MKTLKITLLFALSLILVNCGDDKKKEEKESVKIGASSSESSTAKKSDENVTEVVLLATDMMQFDKNEIRG